MRIHLQNIRIQNPSLICNIVTCTTKKRNFKCFMKQVPVTMTCKCGVIFLIRSVDYSVMGYLPFFYISINIGRNGKFLKLFIQNAYIKDL